MTVKLIPKKEIKAMFFAQYWNQNYQYENRFGKFKGTMSDSNNLYHFNDHLSNNAVLLLKPIHKLSDEDYAQIPVYNRIPKKDFIASINNPEDEFTTNENNYLDHFRKLGYLTDWLDYSKQDLIDFGWVKLI